MEEILNNLSIGETLHITKKGTIYSFIGRDNNYGIIYSIKKGRKTLPLNTIYAAIEALNIGQVINAQWYIEYNKNEYETRGCNLSVLKNLLERLKK